MAEKELFNVRKKFVEEANKALIKQLLDDLFGDGVLNKGEKNSVLEENSTTEDKARSLIDMVRAKGDEASRKMIAHLQSRDASLYSKLGLSSGQPA
ncbi:hypothetical protein VZT92_020797 [Zoarces viviparus]|uniref:CARD domain-containing protein n=1 Tax=Zoarces viviparus TaxID=48416 RepID=A0AAW1EG79_ZOAVI